MNRLFPRPQLYPRPKLERLPEGALMTIGIGVLCSTRPKPSQPRPDCIILVSDTMGSTDFDSTDELLKNFRNDDSKFYVVCAGVIERSAELVPIIQHKIGALKRRSHGTLQVALHEAATEYKRERFYLDVVHSFYSQDQAELRTRFSQEWQQYSLYNTDCQMIVGTFDDNGMAFLYEISQSEQELGLVHLREFPGFATIGTGGWNASFWLKYRGQQLSLNEQQSSYHAYEAKKMASKTPTVNERINFLIATAKGSFALTDDEPEQRGCPVSLANLRERFSKYGPQDTTCLGFATPSTSRMSELEP